MRALAIVFLPLSACLGAVTNVRIAGTSATQAILAYTAPDLAACTVEASQSPSYSPLVPDVDPALFAGANRDDRDGSVASGRDRTFVIGKRAAEPASNGWFRSRALQAYTTHYFRVTCGADSATGSFRTQNIALGNTYPEPYPASTAAPGAVAWPSVNHSGAAGDKVVDPQTGALVTRLTSGGFLASGYASGATLPHVGAFDDSAAANRWITTGASLPAGYTADASAPTRLYVPVDPALLTTGLGMALTGGGSVIDEVTVTITGSATAAGDDAVVKVCPTLDGVSCAQSALVRELSLAGCGSGCMIGSNADRGMNTWFGGKPPSFNGAMLVKTTTTASYNDATGVLDRTSGHQFRGWWTAGSRIWIGGTAHRITATLGTGRITIPAGLGLADPAVVGQAFGFLIWKKTTTAGTGVTITGLSARANASTYASFWDGPFMDQCHPTPVLYGSRQGYHCALKADGAVLAWIDRETAEVNLLGQIAAPPKSGENGWGNYAPAVSFGVSFAPDDPNVLYGVLRDVNGRQVVVRYRYTGDNSPKTGDRLAYYSAPWTANDITNLTPYNPAGTHYDLETLIAQFDNRYDPAQFTCTEDHMNGPYMVIRCQSNAGQDTSPGGWAVVFDPRVTPGPGTNPVIAAVPTSGIGVTNPSPARWCALHALEQGAPGWAGLQFNHTDQAEFRTTLAAAISSATESTIRVTGEPGGGVVDIARAGDIFVIDSEHVRIMAKISATEWLVTRGFGGTTATTHSAGTNVRARCASMAVYGGAHPVWWGFQDDPHGMNATGSTVAVDAPDFYLSHGSYQRGVAVQSGSCVDEVLGWRAKTNAMPPQTFGQRATRCAGVRGFAGARPTTYGSDGHPTLKHLLGAPADEPLWGLDSLWMYSTQFAQPPSLSLVTGATQLYSGTKTLSRKHLPTIAFCGDHPLVDVSGPSSTIADGAADSWKYCVALRNGECRPGSAAGQVFVNCPGRTSGSCSVSNVSGGEHAEDTCVMEMRAQFATTGAVQFGLERSYSEGEMLRRLTSGLARYRRTASHTASNGKPTPAGEWALFATASVDGFRNYHFGVKIPPFPPEDTVSRSTFGQLQVQVGSAPPGTHNVIAEFGYGPELYCGTRREVCIANRSGLETALPYYWASETYAGLPCAGGCTITIPALPERVVYYRLVYRASDNSVLGRSRIQPAQAP